VLNPAGGKFHPKLYLTRSPASAVAVVGSANLTSGLVANIDTGAARPQGRPGQRRTIVAFAASAQPVRAAAFR
jgi:hypothetical protein